MAEGPVVESRHGAGVASPSAPLRMLQARARQFLANGLPACLVRADDNLFALANAAGSAEQRTRYLDALRLWHGLRRDLPAALQGAFDTAFAALGGAAPGPPAVSAGEGLVSDDELDEIIAVDALVAAATAPMGEVLTRLLGRVAALCGAIPAERAFPLTPRFVVAALLREIAPLGSAPPVRRAILNACEATLLKALPEAVAQADRLLEQLGVAQWVPAAAGGALLALLTEPAALDAAEQERVRLLHAAFVELATAAWIPPALGELLAAAELPLLACARTDPDFLTRPLHPARRLVQEIIVAATDMLPAADYAERELFRRGRAAIAELAEPGIDAARLAALLVEFASLADRERERQERCAAPALRDASARERADMAHARVLQTLENRVSGRRYPLALIDLLERGWCRVLCDAWLHQGERSPQWRGAVHLLDQLIGVLGDVDPDPELVDRLLETLAARLGAAGLEAHAARRLLDRLRPSLCRESTPSPAPPSLVLTPAEARELDDGRLLVIAAGLELALPGNPARAVQDPAADLSEVDLGRVDALRPGGWVEFRDAAGGALRARFLGAVPPADTHVFADAGGVPVRQLPRLRLALALRDGEVLPLDNSQLFERALARARNAGAVPP